MPGRLSVCVVSQPVARFWLLLCEHISSNVLLVNCISATTRASALLFIILGFCEDH